MPKQSQETRGNRVIISVLGPDRVGIIAGVANILSENNINILDISQTIIQEYLAMVIIADMEKSAVNMGELKERLASKEQELGIKIDAQHEDIFNFMHRL
jgi:ACT domain-containing protein